MIYDLIIIIAMKIKCMEFFNINLKKNVMSFEGRNSLPLTLPIH